MLTVIYGAAEKDLFDGYGSGHDTYFADERWLTTVDSDDAEVYCDHDCAEAALLGSGYAVAVFEEGRKFWVCHDGRYADATLYPGEGEGECLACGETN